MEQNEKGKSWLYHLRYLKMWKTNHANHPSTSEAVPLNNQRLSTNYNEFQGNNNARNDHSVAFRRNFTSNSLGNHTESAQTGNQLRKSLKKWHRRMKNCFSKNAKHITERQIIHISPAPASPNSSRITLATQSYPKENVYSLDPIPFQYKSRSPVSDRSTTNSTILSPSISPSRFTIQSENIPTPPPRSLERNRPPLLPRSPSRNSPIADCFLGNSPLAQCPHSAAQSPAHTTRTPSPESGNVPTNEVASLAYCTWYWGPASRSQVEKKLNGAPDGSFLVRDSTSDRYIFSISFRSVGLTLHSRIEYTSRSGYKLFDHDGYSSVKDLIEQAVEVSKNGIYCYTKNRRGDNTPNYPVRLTKPISRYDKVRSLQNLARFVIRQKVNLNDIDNLSLPATLITYLKEETIF